jgi:hypothetical protein
MMLSALATLRRKVCLQARDESGQTVLIVAGVLMGIAMTGLALFLNLDAGQRIINRLKGGNANQGTVVQAVLAYYFQNMTNGVGVLPCPDTAATPTGTATDTDINATYCDGSSASHANVGVLPWKTLGISRDQALDANGNYFTYVVAPSLTAKQLCDTVATDFGGPDEVPGTLTPSALQITTPAGATEQIPFAIIGHGANGLGARTSRNHDTGTPASTTELANCDPTTCAANSPVMGTSTSDPTNPSANGVLVAGPFTGSQGASAFDDQVYYPTRAALEKICQSLTPGGALNAILTDDFSPVAAASDANGDGLEDRKYSAESHGVETRSDRNGRYARFANGGAGAVGAALITNKDNYNTDSRVVPIYSKVIWTPDITGVGQGGISIATRVTGADQGTNSDVFSAVGLHGITTRFYSTGNVSASGVANTISIVDDTGSLGDSGTDTYLLMSDKSYLVETYDDGTNVWGRITQTDNYANTATVHITSTPTDDDLDGNNQVAIIGGPNTNRVASLLIGYGMSAFNTNGTGYVTRATNLAQTGSLTAEAWIRPRVLPTSASGPGVILGSWDPTADMTNNNAANANSFRLYVTSDNKLALDLSGNGVSPDTLTANLALKVGEWTHVAAVYETNGTTTHTVTFYVNGTAVGGAQDTTALSLNAATPAEFTVGANAATVTPSNYFNGDISDVRVWSTARSAAQIRANYSSRLSYATPGTDAGLVLNWKLDVDGFNGPTTVVSTGANAYSTGTTTTQVGTIVAGGTGYATATGGAGYVGALTNYYRLLAGTPRAAGTPTGVCHGHVAHLYECAYTTAGTFNLHSSYTNTDVFPANLNVAHVKAFGGGGGGYDTTLGVAAGGGAGYSAGVLSQINSTRLTGVGVDVVVGGGGTGSTTAANGAGGGGASWFRLTTLGTPGVVAGGGGGASFSNNALSPVCDSLVGDLSNQCGLGGGGGGPGNFPLFATTLRAVDAGGLVCGGRGGDTAGALADPPNYYCPDPATGGNPIATVGGDGGGTSGGGASVTAGDGEGGGGYDSTDGGAGAGGGGGGVIDATFATGGGEAGGYAQIAYNSVTIGNSGAPTEGDRITLNFVNLSHTYTYTVQDSTTDPDANAVAMHLAAGLSADLTGAFGTTFAVRYTAATNYVEIFAKGVSGGAVTLLASVAARTTTETLSFSCGTATGGTFAGTVDLATCDLTIGGSAQTGDFIDLTFTNANIAGIATAYPFSYEVQSSDTTVALIAQHLSDGSHLGGDATLSGAGLTFGGLTGSTFTMTQNDSSGHHADQTVVTGAVNPPAPTDTATVLYADPLTFVTAGTSNGFGGGGGSGYADTDATNVSGQRGPSIATATISGTTFEAGDTVTITLTNSSIAAWGAGVNETITITADDVNSSSPRAAIASKLAAHINGDATNQLQTNGVSAYSRGNVVTIVQHGAYTVTTQLSASADNTNGSNSSVTFSPASGYLASGAAGGITDFSYTDATFASGFNRGRGGVNQSTTGQPVNGNSGAVLLFW